MSQNIIAEIATAVKGGANLEDVIPLGADITLWQKLVNNYNPNPKPKRSRNGNGRATRRSQYARMQSALNAATLKLVERANGKEAAGDSWYTIKTADYTARVDRETGRVTYEDNERC